ncbi:MAG: DUF58 domain-containing protein [Lysobacterales bacterium]
MANSSEKAGTAVRRDFFDWVFRFLSKFGGHRPPTQLPAEVNRRQVYIVPTRFGAFFGFVLLVLLLGALNYNNNMALLFTFLLSALGLLTPLYTVRNLTGLQLLQVKAAPVFAGQTAEFVLTIMNPSSAPRPMIWARAQGAATFTQAPAQGRADLGIEVEAPERGWLSLPRSRIFSTFPVGLFYAWTWVNPSSRCLIYPSQEVDAPALPRGSNRGTGRPERSGDEEWSGLRDYQAGDPSRSIAWKVVARSDQMVTKTFSDHHSEQLHLDFDRLEGLTVEQRLSRLCRWIVIAEDEQLDYELILPRQRLGPDRGTDHQHQCLRALAEYPN